MAKAKKTVKRPGGRPQGENNRQHVTLRLDPNLIERMNALIEKHYPHSFRRTHFIERAVLAAVESEERRRR